MHLAPGTHLGAYEILSALGAGGMGEVYRARDTRLKREVAIKVLPDAFSRDPERLARFRREAELLATLNHPNIAAVYGLEETPAGNAIVLELVDGPTLANRIARGPLPLDEALPIARQLAAALDAAHEKGIVHRDLKPANIKVTSDGTVKVLDFGLAKLTEAAGSGQPAAGSASISPTITSPGMMTNVGVILGTAAYMSPEQARGRSADKRSDIWALGVVLYELLTGERLFKGEDVTDMLAAVIKEPPDISKAPPQVHRLLRKCLEKDPRRRLRDIGDAWELLDDRHPVDTSSVKHHSARLPWAVAAICAIAAAGVAVIHFREPAPPPAMVRFQIPAPEAAGAPNPVISPDGKRIVYQDANLLWVRDVDSLDARPLPSTEGTLSNPFWSADSRFVVFGDNTGTLNKIDVAGGPPQPLCALPGILLGGFWTADDRIVFSSGGGLFEVGVSGDEASPLKIVDDAGFVSLIGGAPALPDRRHFVYGLTIGPDRARGIYVASRRGDESPKRLLPDQSNVAYVPSLSDGPGYLLFIRGSTLLAQRLNLASLELTGEPVRLADDVQSFSASASGSLVYRTGAGGRRLTWFNRQGVATGTVGAPSSYLELTLSRDGSRAAVVRADPFPPTTWVHEFARDASTPMLFETSSVKPVWSPDGTQLVVASTRGRQFDLLRNLANGTGKEALVLGSETSKYPWDITPDGRWLLYGNVNPKTKEDLWLVAVDGEPKPERVLVTDYVETDGVFSPDGRFIAYVSDESGRFEVYVRSFPVSSGGKWVASKGGGYQPRWRRDGRELFYFSNDGRLMSVDTEPGAEFRVGPARVLFQVPIFGGGASTNNHYWDVAPDGQRFLINTVSAESDSASLTVVLNWQAALTR